MASTEAKRDGNAAVTTPPPAAPKPSAMGEFSKKFVQYFRLLVYAEPSKREILLLVVGVIASIAAGVPFPLLGILFGQLMDDLNTATCSNTSQTAASAAAYQAAVDDKVLKVVYISIASFVLIYTYILSWNLAGERLAQRLRAKYFRSLLKQEASFFDKLTAGEVSSRLNGDIQLIQAGTSEKVGIYVATLSFFVTSYIIAFIKDAKLAGTLISLVPCFFAMSLVGGHYIKKFAGRMSDYSAKASSLASEALSSMTIVHAFSANERLEKKFSDNLKGARKQGINKAVTTSIQSGLLYFIAFSANALAFWMGSRTIAEAVGLNSDEASVGTTYTVIFLLVDATLMLSQVAPFLQIFGSAAAAFEKLEKDINHQSLIDGTQESQGAILTPETVHGHIELRDVSFIYPSRPDTTVLQKISIDCPAGKHTAIVGLSGSGKSTIAGLTTRLYDPTEGKVFLDGQDLREINVRSLRSFISLVQQEPSLLDRSILENIALGLINSPRHAHLKETLMTSQLADIAEILRKGNETLDTVAESRGSEIKEIVILVREAAANADALTFINRLEHGFATLVGSSGTLISGGQKQRIAVARALIRDPTILILDEATASLDSSSEQRILAAIEKVATGRTLISIAHRLSTIKNADNIIVMGQGGYILEQGTHSELIAKDGAYAGLVRLQSMSTEKTNDEETSTIEAGKSSIDGSSANEILDEKSPRAIEQSAPPTPNPDADKPEEEKPVSTLEMIGKVGTLLRPYVLFLLVAFAGATVVGGTYPSSAVIFGNTVGSLSPCNSEERIRQRGNLFGLLFFILAIAEFFANFASWSMFGIVAEKILYKVQVLSFRSLLEQNIEWHTSENRTPATLLGFITKDASALGSLTGSIIGTIFGILVNLLAAIIMTHIIAWRIALVCLAVVPLLLGAGYMQLRALTAFAEKHAGAFAKSIGITVEAVNSIKTISALSLEHEIASTYRRSLAAPRKEITFASAYANLWLAIAYGVGNFVYALAYWWGAKQIVAGNSTQTQFFIVLLAMLVSVQLWAQMFTLMPEVSRAFTAAGRILKLLEIGSAKDLAAAARSLDKPSNESEKDVESTAVSEKSVSQPSTIASIKGATIRFDSVSFTYPSRPDNKILNSLSLSINPGQFVALVGPSGAGKSTIISLIERLYTPTTGTITIDGLDISRADITFRNDIALVPQDSVLFDATIAFNLSLGARSGHTPTQAELEEACRIANIHDTIAALPEGYNTPCGPNGRLLSGGQRQRVAMARALVRRPKLLLLDESTSALDAESERAVSEGLERVVKETGCTVVVIAHRLVTVRKADVIVVVEDGRVVDMGRHEELAERCEGYRVNVMHQAVDA